jgi:hypothetical protein
MVEKRNVYPNRVIKAPDEGGAPAPVVGAGAWQAVPAEKNDLASAGPSIPE